MERKMPSASGVQSVTIYRTKESLPHTSDSRASQALIPGNQWVRLLAVSND